MPPAGVPPSMPSPRSIDVALAGMLNTTQCQKPLGVGASGSNIVSTKPCVPAGLPLQCRLGETLNPEQPKLSKTCSLSMVDPSGISSLASVKPAIVGGSGCE